ncbi:4-hydroxyphenylpyruvate dioxygenase [Streptomyces sp. NPDC021093]|uniref:4-hydroxyphenylpyruvate dioxygenase n=1 Tax=Streptomyces sp. NPDC021093 TaxID=3365112 RepID=UPI0037A8B3F1
MGFSHDRARSRSVLANVSGDDVLERSGLEASARPAGGAAASHGALGVRGFDSVVFAVGNARQAAHFYATAFGMSLTAYRGPETGHRDDCSYVLESGTARFVVTGAARPDTPLAGHVAVHGDGVCDVRIAVEDVPTAYAHAVAGGARALEEPHRLADEHGVVELAAIAAYGPVRHTFVDRSRYRGPYLPGFQPRAFATPVPARPYFDAIDHCVAAVEAGRMEEWVDFYQRVLGFSTMTEFVDGEIATRYSALRSIVVADPARRVKFPVVEPAASERASQVDEFLRFHAGPGIQHVALATQDIRAAVSAMRQGGVEFLDTPDTYYDDPALPGRLEPLNVSAEDLRHHGILLDSDTDGTLLQILTRPLQDRPTGFFELIERHGSLGFGVGNFAALFHAIERAQDGRGNLTPRAEPASAS